MSIVLCFGDLKAASEMAAIVVNEGLRLVPGFLPAAAQEQLLDALDEVVAAAPFYTPVMPRSGQPFSIEMTNAGPLGWVSDRAGYRYQATHPATGQAWPDIPGAILDAWADLSQVPSSPNAA